MNTVIRSSLAILLAATGFAASAQVPGSDQRMQGERAVCDGVQQDRAACLREAGAARDEARRNGLTAAPPTSYEQNALARCSLQTNPSDQADCEKRMRGTGSTAIEGSVMGGGLIRETVTPIPAPAR